MASSVPGLDEAFQLPRGGSDAALPRFDENLPRLLKVAGQFFFTGWKWIETQQVSPDPGIRDFKDT